MPGQHPHLFAVLNLFLYPCDHRKIQVFWALWKIRMDFDMKWFYFLLLVIEKFTENTRFCLICNYLSKIIPALQSRCTRFRFGPLTPELMVPRLEHVVEEEKWVFCGPLGMECSRNRLVGWLAGSYVEERNVGKRLCRVPSTGEALGTVHCYHFLCRLKAIPHKSHLVLHFSWFHPPPLEAVPISSYSSLSLETAGCWVPSAKMLPAFLD